MCIHMVYEQTYLCPLAAYIYVCASGWQNSRPAGTSSLGGGGACPPARNRPGLPIGVLGLNPWPDTWPPAICIGLGCRNNVLFGDLAARSRAASFA